MQQAAQIRALAEAEAEKSARIGIAQALAIEEQVRAYGGPQFQVAREVMSRFADAIQHSKVDVVPKILIGASAGAVVRVGWYLQVRPSFDPNGPEAPRKSVTDHYVAIPLADQLACLLSLMLGARFRSGGEVRDFSADPQADPGALHHGQL